MISSGALVLVIKEFLILTLYPLRKRTQTVGTQTDGNIRCELNQQSSQIRRGNVYNVYKVALWPRRIPQLDRHCPPCRLHGLYTSDDRWVFSMTKTTCQLRCNIFSVLFSPLHAWNRNKNPARKSVLFFTMRTLPFL